MSYRSILTVYIWGVYNKPCIYAHSCMYIHVCACTHTHTLPATWRMLWISSRSSTWKLLEVWNLELCKVKQRINKLSRNSGVWKDDVWCAVERVRKGLLHWKIVDWTVDCISLMACFSSWVLFSNLHVVSSFLGLEMSAVFPCIRSYRLDLAWRLLPDNSMLLPFLILTCVAL